MLHYTVVNKETCESCGLCCSIAPDIYQLDCKSKAFGALDHNEGIIGIPTTFLNAMVAAYESCPTNSIRVGKESFENQKLENGMRMD
ncbi:MULTISPECIES: ferredoxin [Bacillus]|uniref:ferredoxin n=1 Tax=Bacillus TaxID=1386 RepID=UPI00099281A0|nr:MULTISPECIES: ferredoxin [Bacillus]MBK5506559.1 ferredoxin [Bacillus sp. TH12]OOR18554.1 ferredoxin [Bacillus mycoides]PGA09881.1 ferredoxin [Bacillus mycoides]QWG80556.1 ferredoxin [Bacillus mycoides]QWI73743.1 ferredoxin [Bacillus mycoides]